MRSRTVTCVQLNFSVTVVEAMPFMNLHRDLLLQRALAEAAHVSEQRDDLPSADLEQSRWGTLCTAYAICLAVTVQSRGFDHCVLTLTEFAVLCAFAEPFAEAWLDCALELNPSWRLYTRSGLVN